MDFTRGKKTNFSTQYQEEVSRMGPNGEMDTMVTKKFNKGEVVKDKCRIISSFKQLLGIRKDLCSTKCKKVSFFECAKRGLKRISCGKGISNSEGNHWEETSQIHNSSGIWKQHNQRSTIRNKIKKKIVYKDENGNIIPPEMIQNGEYIRKNTTDN